MHRSSALFQNLPQLMWNRLALALLGISSCVFAVALIVRVGQFEREVGVGLPVMLPVAGLALLHALVGALCAVLQLNALRVMLWGAVLMLALSLATGLYIITIIMIVLDAIALILPILLARK